MVKNIKCKARRYKEWNGREGMEYSSQACGSGPIRPGDCASGTVFDIPVTGIKNETLP